MLIDGRKPICNSVKRNHAEQRWINESEIKQDSRQNDIRPGRISTPCWQETPLEDVDGLFNEPLEPSIVPDFKEYAKTLRDKKAEIEKLSGSSGTEAETLEKNGYRS